MTQLWDGPVELHNWNGRLEIRDVKKKTLFYLHIDTREYWAVKKLTEQIGPLLVDLMNDAEEGRPPYVNPNPTKYVSRPSIDEMSEFVSDIKSIDMPFKRKRGRPAKVKA